jgi:hypothetical protein
MANAPTAAHPFERKLESKCSAHGPAPSQSDWWTWCSNGAGARLIEISHRDVRYAAFVEGFAGSNKAKRRVEVFKVDLCIDMHDRIRVAALHLEVVPVFCTGR